MSDIDVMSWRFLRSVAWWSLAVGLVAAALGWAMGGGLAFAGPAAVGVAFDVLSFGWVVDRGEEVSEENPAKGLRLASLWVLARMGVKLAALAGLAAVAPPLMVWGLLTGLLAVDVTILVRGSAEALARVGR